MNRARPVCLLLAALAAGGAFALEFKVECDRPGAWKIDSAETGIPGAGGSVREFVVRLKAPVAAEPPRFAVTFDVPQRDAHHKWTYWSDKVTLPPDWNCRTDSRLCKGLPLVAFLNDGDRNRICVAASEAKRTVTIGAGVREEDCHIAWKIEFFAEPEAPISAYEVKVRVDARDVFFGEAIADGTAWIEKTAGLRPLPAPEAAFDPLYSSWYAFHHRLSARDVEAECAEAVKLGMRTVIVDDGWETDDDATGFSRCGDWRVSRRRFPDFAAHVAKVRALGMRYMVWLGVPMMGLKAENHPKFANKRLWTKSGYSCLDPRFPEVRAYVCDACERLMRDYGLDGLKLDFIDTFEFRGGDPAAKADVAGRDVRSLPEAVDRLLSEIRTRLVAVRPDALVEFRQSYVGPAARQYGNMLRAADCPGDLLQNRFRTANLRLTSGGSAVHSDMLEWDVGDTPEHAARFVLSSLFATVQYSVMLRTLPAAHRRMLAHWLGFSQRHRGALLKGAFRPHGYAAHYPWIEAEDAGERIVGVYAAGTCADLGALDRDTHVLNGTGGTELILRAEREAEGEAFDTFGGRVGTVKLVRGVQAVKLPESGYLSFGKRRRAEKGEGE